MTAAARTTLERRPLARFGLEWLFAPPALLFVAFLSVPIVALIWRAVDSGELGNNVTSSLVVDSLRLSAITSTFTLAIAIIIGTPLAYLLARRQFPGKFVIDTLLDLPIVLPPTVAGVALLVALGRRGVVGQHLGWTDVAFTTWAVVLAQLFVSAPFYIRTAKAGFEEVEPRLEGVAWTLGASPLRTFWRVTLPLAWRGERGPRQARQPRRQLPRRPADAAPPSSPECQQAPGPPARLLRQWERVPAAAPGAGA